MDEYGEGPGHVTPQLLSNYRKQTRDTMRGRGLLKPSGSGSGWHCLNCGDEEDENTQLLRCSRCQTARYCSKACQRAHWPAGHKETCQPPEDKSEARLAERLLATAVLREEQVIARNAAVPPLPASRADRALPPDVASVLPRDLMSILDFNRRPGNKERFCPNCRTHYRLLPNPSATDRAAKEQQLSGICSFACFNQMHPEGPNSGPDWFGQEAAPPDGAVQFMVDPHPDSIFY